MVIKKKKEERERKAGREGEKETGREKRRKGGGEEVTRASDVSIYISLLWAYDVFPANLCIWGFLVAWMVKNLTAAMPKIWV